MKGKRIYILIAMLYVCIIYAVIACYDEIDIVYELGYEAGFTASGRSLFKNININTCGDGTPSIEIRKDGKIIMGGVLIVDEGTVVFCAK